MKNEQELLLLITEFKKYSYIGIDIIRKHFGINTSPYKARLNEEIPKQGLIIQGDQRLHFWFHGKGCDLTFDDSIHVDIDFEVTTLNGIEWNNTYFSTNKFYRFISNLKKSETKLKDYTTYLETIHKLEQQNKLVRHSIYIDSFNYPKLNNET